MQRHTLVVIIVLSLVSSSFGGDGIRSNGGNETRILLSPTLFTLELLVLFALVALVIDTCDTYGLPSQRLNFETENLCILI